MPKNFITKNVHAERTSRTDLLKADVKFWLKSAWWHQPYTEEQGAGVALQLGVGWALPAARCAASHNPGASPNPFESLHKYRPVNMRVYTATNGKCSSTLSEQVPESGCCVTRSQ